MAKGLQLRSPEDSEHVLSLVIGLLCNALGLKFLRQVEHVVDESAQLSTRSLVKPCDRTVSWMRSFIDSFRSAVVGCPLHRDKGTVSACCFSLGYTAIIQSIGKLAVLYILE